MPDGLLSSYDATELERQYNPRSFTPNAEDLMGIPVDLSAAFRNRGGAAAMDVPYGTDTAERLDLFLPGNPAGAPVEMYIHGGYWRARSKNDFSFMADPIVTAGGICAAVGYALCPEVTLDEIVRQMRAATVWLYKNIGEHGGDPNRIHVSGHSAGGHLTAMMIATDWPKFEAGLPADLVKSALPISGIFDIEPIIGTSIQKDVQLDAESAGRNSPLRHPIANKGTLGVTVGSAESEEFKAQSKAYVEHARAEGLTVEFFEIPGKNHFTILTDATTPDYPLTEARLRLMGLA
jgi:arylformamidase